MNPFATARKTIMALMYQLTSSRLLHSLAYGLATVIFWMSVEHTTHADDINSEPTTRISFDQQIRPIFNKHCTACHGGVKQAAEISFAYRDQVLPPNGWIVQPGDPDASVLIERILSDDPELRMPPPEHGPALSTDEVKLLTQWIQQGASWQEHWAYEKPQAHPAPEVETEDWCRQKTDWFILANLERKGLQPSVDATPERWLRRVTLDLIGLPPTIQARDAFLNDVKANGEIAYQKEVDRLLASTSFGERWASVWLDQVRYADSKGLGADGKRNIWKYRDWVIDCFNRDLPYDQFTIKQIAGDLLPNPTIEDLIATAAHRLTQTNEEGGTDDEEFRVAAVLDRVNTTWQAWQGVTFGCVQCHSHPYDPIRHDEYYKFAAFFNNTSDVDLNEDWPVVQAPIDPKEYPQAAELDQQINATNQKIWQAEFNLLKAENLWQALNDVTVACNKPTNVIIETINQHHAFKTVDTVAQNSDFTIESAMPAGVNRLTAIRLTALPLDLPTAARDSEWGFVLSHIEAQLLVPGVKEPQTLTLVKVIADEPDPFFDPKDSLDPKSDRGFAAYTRIHYPRQAAFILDQPVWVPEGTRLQVTLKHRVNILASFSLITRSGYLEVTSSPLVTEIGQDEELQILHTRLGNLKKQRNAIPSTSVPILQERDKHLSRPTHVFVRGLFLTKDKEVTADTPKFFPPLPKDGPANRLALANWLVSKENPLTARVAVNRVWAQLFGTGLVSTEEDFGSSGERPSHPELLDDLAVRFQNEHAWSFKKLARELVLSRTYRQSAKVTPSLLQQDAHNRWLGRGPRVRLTAEMVRDQALAVCGLLSDRMAGPPVHPPIPEGVWQPFSGNDHWNTAGIDDENRYRRSVYTYTKRSIPYPMFAAFDAPSRETCSARRLRSNTPLQALMTMNDLTFAECAQSLGQRMLENGDDRKAQIRYGFVRVTCREPSESEIVDLLKLDQLLHEDKTGPDASQTDLKLTNIASVLLNLDEFLTK